MIEQLKKATFALIGTAEFAVDKAKHLAKRARSRAKDGRKDLESFYRDASKRGERLVSEVRRSRAADRAVAGTEQASKEVKRASTSARKAVRPEEDAGKAKKKAS